MGVGTRRKKAANAFVMFHVKPLGGTALMDFKGEHLISLLSGVVATGLVYVFEGIWKLKRDMNHAFKKIRRMEKHCGLDTSENGHERDVEDPKRALHGKDAGSRP